MRVIRVIEDYEQAREFWVDACGQMPPAAAEGDFIGRAGVVLAISFGGLHHCQSMMLEATFPGRRLIDVYCRNTLATQDADLLTRLVFAAHRHAIRVEIGPGDDYSFRIRLSDRGRGLDLFEEHPTAEQALASFRRKYPAESDWNGGADA